VFTTTFVVPLPTFVIITFPSAVVADAIVATDGVTNVAFVIVAVFVVASKSIFLSNNLYVPTEIVVVPSG